MARRDRELHSEYCKCVRHTADGYSELGDIFVSAVGEVLEIVVLLVAGFVNSRCVL